VNRYHATIDSNADDVIVAAAMVRKLCAESGMSEIDTYHVELCVCEATVNVIRHGYHSRRGNTVSVEAFVDTDRIELVISDNGMPMSAESAARLIHGPKIVESDPADIQSLSEGGRGLRIIHQIMDKISYATEGSVNRLSMTKYFAGAGSLGRIG
jgi:serine/threonine-protein kinase RsbW